jgi:hypothetical protein
MVAHALGFEQAVKPEAVIASFVAASSLNA